MIRSGLSPIFCRYGHGIITLASIVLLLTGCQPHSEFTDDRYYDSTGAFSVIVSGVNRNEVQENTFPGKGSVVHFPSFMGTKTRIEVELLHNVMDPIRGTNCPESIAKLLSDCFHQATLLRVMKNCPLAKIIHEEVITPEQGLPGLFVVLRIPEGSTWFNQNEQRMLDNFEGYLMFFEGDQLVTITEDSPDVVPMDRIGLLREYVCKIRATYRNERCKMLLEDAVTPCCCNTSFPNVKGRVHQNRYFDPSGFFSIDIPNSLLMRTFEIEESLNLDNHATMVLFRDTRGQCSKRVNVDIIEDASYLELFREQNKAGELFQELFKEVTLPAYKRTCKGISLKIEEIITPGSNDGMFFAVVEIPDGQYIDNRTGASVSGLMGTLFFSSGRQLVMLSYLIPFIPETTFTDNVEHLRQDLLEMHRTYRTEEDSPNIDPAFPLSAKALCKKYGSI